MASNQIDHFAGLAMQVLLSHELSGEDPVCTYSLAQNAYDFASVMVEMRARLLERAPAYFDDTSRSHNLNEQCDALNAILGNN